MERLPTLKSPPQEKGKTQKVLCFDNGNQRVCLRCKRGGSDCYLTDFTRDSCASEWNLFPSSQSSMSSSA
jgi:hypothetical protein